MSKQTPWGQSQDETGKAPGIVRYSTASHGGFGLSAEREAELRAIFPDFRCFAGKGWYEEDQDWAIVVVAFPRYFSEEEIYHAVETIQASVKMERDLYGDNGRGYWRIAQLIKGTLVEKIASQFKASRVNFWQVGSMGTSGKGWSVSLRRLGDGAADRPV